MVGHLLEYHPGVRKLKELADTGELGDRIYYIYGNRLNLGKLRADENALWSLGAHDVSVVLYLAGEIEHDRDVVGSQAPERVLVRAQLAEVEPVAVDVVDPVTELPGIGQLLELAHAGVVLEQVPDHQHPAGGARRLHRAL